jgi:hypothetical protein
MDIAWVWRQIDRKKLIRINKTQMIGNEETKTSANRFLRPLPPPPCMK